MKKRHRLTKIKKAPQPGVVMRVERSSDIMSDDNYYNTLLTVIANDIIAATPIAYALATAHDYQPKYSSQRRVDISLISCGVALGMSAVISSYYGGVSAYFIATDHIILAHLIRMAYRMAYHPSAYSLFYRMAGTVAFSNMSSAKCKPRRGALMAVWPFLLRRYGSGICLYVYSNENGRSLCWPEWHDDSIDNEVLK